MDGDVDGLCTKYPDQVLFRQQAGTNEWASGGVPSIKQGRDRDPTTDKNLGRKKKNLPTQQ